MMDKYKAILQMINSPDEGDRHLGVQLLSQEPYLEELGVSEGREFNSVLSRLNASTRWLKEKEAILMWGVDSWREEVKQYMKRKESLSEKLKDNVEFYLKYIAKNQ